MGAAMGLGNVTAITRSPQAFAPFVGEVRELYADLPRTDPRQEWVAALVKAIPRRSWDLGGVSAPLLTATTPTASGRRDRHRQRRVWEWCTAAAEEFSDAAQLRPQPMLARLMYDAAFGEDEWVSCTAFHLLGAVPVVRHHAEDALVDIISSVEDPTARSHAAWRLAGARLGRFPDRAHTWFDDPRLHTAALMLAGQAGRPPAPGLLPSPTLAPDDFDPVTYAYAMSGTPPPLKSPAATWWANEGPRIVDLRLGRPSSPAEPGPAPL